MINTLPSFMDQGEFKKSSSIADVVEVECEPVFAEHTIRFSSQELFSRCQHHLTWSLPYPYNPVSGSGFTVTLDNDGNATAVIMGGPGCAAGESLISAHMEQAPFTTVTTAFTVLPPRPTPPGVTASPKEEVENEVTSSVATIVQVEFPPVFAEAYVNINAEQLYSALPHARRNWCGSARVAKLGEGVDTINGVQLDNDGNAFVVLLGGGSCASGTSLIEASLEDAPYTTYTTTFTILPPQPTLPVEPGFTIEKLQRIEGEGPFTKNELTGEIGQVVEYQIVVTNTGNTPLEFTNFSDPHCEGIAGGPGGKPVQPGPVDHLHVLAHAHERRHLDERGHDQGQRRHRHQGIQRSRRQSPAAGQARLHDRKAPADRRRGAFTKNELTGKLGQTSNTRSSSRTPAACRSKFSNFSDPNCEGIAGGAGGKLVQPGESTTFTCSHKLTSPGTWTNVATIEGNEGTGSKESNEVVVESPAADRTRLHDRKAPAHRTAKGPFTKNELTGKVGQVVEYEIIVRNTGNVPLEFTNFTDAELRRHRRRARATTRSPSADRRPTRARTRLRARARGPTSPRSKATKGRAKTSNEVIVNVPPEPACGRKAADALRRNRVHQEKLTGDRAGVYYEIIVQHGQRRR